jgi:hypothetical protein
LHSEEIQDFYIFKSLIGVRKSRRTRWGRHVAGMGKKRNAWTV